MKTILSFLAALCLPLFGDSVSLAWDRNPETDIEYYQLKYGTSPNTYSNNVVVGTNIEATVSDLVAGQTYYFAVAAVNLAGLTSPNSDEVSYFVRILPPSPLGWKTKEVDSEEYDGYQSEYAFDGNPNTFWNTRWRAANPPFPHEIQIDLGSSQPIGGFTYLPRQDGDVAGNVAQYEFYVSVDGENWGSPVSTGNLPKVSTLVEVRFPTTAGRYIKFRGLSEQTGGTSMNVAELGLLAPLPLVPPSAPTGLRIK